LAISLVLAYFNVFCSAPGYCPAFPHVLAPSGPDQHRAQPVVVLGYEALTVSGLLTFESFFFFFPFFSCTSVNEGVSFTEK
jgi:hypothetical protein